MNNPDGKIVQIKGYHLEVDTHQTESFVIDVRSEDGYDGYDWASVSLNRDEVKLLVEVLQEALYGPRKPTERPACTQARLTEEGRQEVARAALDLAHNQGVRASG